MDYLVPTRYPLVLLIKKWSELGKVHIWPDLTGSLAGEDFARQAKAYCRRVPLKSLGGFSMRYSYNNFGGIDPLSPLGIERAKKRGS